MQFDAKFVKIHIW